MAWDKVHATQWLHGLTREEVERVKTIQEESHASGRGKREGWTLYCVGTVGRPKQAWLRHYSIDNVLVNEWRII